MNINDLEARAGEAAKLLKAMSNPHRLSILCRLLEGERRVSELEEAVGLSQSALSQHLARLRGDGLVATRREAQNIYYSLAGDDVHQLLAVLHRIFCDMPRGAAGPGPRKASGPSRRGASSEPNRSTPENSRKSGIQSRRNT